uniref:Uncharacterized protein n=1 Tax=Oryza glumipatula TaxID=40148 RepID=A0A0D9YA36_9ORYZ
ICCDQRRRRKELIATDSIRGTSVDKVTIVDQAIVFTRNWGVPSGLALCRHENLLRLWFVGDGELLVVLVAFEHRVDVGIHQVLSSRGYNRENKEHRC